jgi:hypothetical protein
MLAVTAGEDGGAEQERTRIGAGNETVVPKDIIPPR